jgi:hypothetical protein
MELDSPSFAETFRIASPQVSPIAIGGAITQPGSPTERIFSFEWISGIGIEGYDASRITRIAQPSRELAGVSSDVDNHIHITSAEHSDNGAKF